MLQAPVSPSHHGPVYLGTYPGRQSTLFKLYESRKPDLYQRNPSISHHTALTLHIVWHTVAMARGIKSGEFEIGELTSISSPGRLFGSSAGSEGSGNHPPLPGDGPSPPLCFPFSNEEAASHQELGEWLSILGDPCKSDRGYCCRPLRVFIVERRSYLGRCSDSSNAGQIKNRPAPLVSSMRQMCHQLYRWVQVQSPYQIPNVSSNGCVCWLATSQKSSRRPGGENRGSVAAFINSRPTMSCLRPCALWATNSRSTPRRRP